jgi:hypothetical protein
MKSVNVFLSNDYYFHNKKSSVLDVKPSHEIISVNSFIIPNPKPHAQHYLFLHIPTFLTLKRALL